MIRRPGFTIIELLVVITIIGILLGAAGLLGSHALLTSRDTQRLSDALLISKSIDEYATTTRGLYPKNANSGSANTTILCTQELQGSGISLSQFTNQSLPNDPRPVQKMTTGCTSFLNGYTYHTWYTYNGAALPSLQDACTDPISGTTPSPSLAICQNVAYSIEVGLEGIKPSDEPLFSQPSHLTEVRQDNSTTSLSTAFADQNISGSRYRYILNGSVCPDRTAANTPCYQ